MTKQELIAQLKARHEEYCEKHNRGLEGAIDVATGLFEAICLIEEQLDEPKECGFRQFCPILNTSGGKE